MGNLRIEAESDLGEMLESDFGQQIFFKSPNTGNTFDVQGRFDLYPSRENPDTGQMIIIANASVSVRASTMPEIPKAGEKWAIRAQPTPVENAPFEDFVMTPDQAPEEATRMGWITIFLQRIEQS